MVKFVVTIQNKTFSTKKSLAEKCKEILNSYKDGDRLNMFDEEFMIDFFTQLAKSHKLKGKKIVEVDVRKSKKFRNNLQFWIKREDGTQTDISYINCIRPRKKLMKYQTHAEGLLKTSLLSTNITMFIQQLVN